MRTSELIYYANFLLKNSTFEFFCKTNLLCSRKMFAVQAFNFILLVYYTIKFYKSQKFL